MSKIRVLSVQIGWTPDKKDNLKRAERLMEDGLANHENVDVICLPEFFYVNPTKKNRDTIGEPITGSFFQFFSAFAAKHKVNIITGTFPKQRDGKLYNTALAIDRHGNLIGKYSKAHLFDAFHRKESDILAAGNEPGIVEFDFGRVGIAICYELRFPEYLRTLALKGIDVLFVPAAFYRPRADQWELLVTGAALSNLIYVVSANQYNDYCFGRSQIADPCGKVISKAEDGEGVIFGELDLDYQKEVRREIGGFDNRRPELYHI